MKTRNFLVKMLATVFTLVMLASVAGNVNEVQAVEEAELKEMLGVKCQVTQGIVTDTDIDHYRDNYVMRFVSSIDSLEYRKVGFELSYTDENGKTVTRKNTTKTVFKRIESTTGSTGNGRDTYTFSPKVISTESEYFITAKWPVAKDDIDKDYTVRAFVITKDNETVYGAKRCVSVSDGLKEKTSINLSVDADLDKNASYSATYTNNAGESVSIASENVKVLHSEDGVSSVRLLNANKALKSVTEISIKDASENVVATVLQRNLYTEYDPNNTNTVDTSWYDLADKNADKYIIATSADLYGLAKIANEGGASKVKDNFASKEIYVVSDITVNKETLITESMDDNYGEWRSYNNETGEYTYAAAPSCTWTPISEFAGKFYGEGHTISGLYSYSTTTNRLAFIHTTLETAELRNFKLVNSSFIRTTSFRNAVPTASIVGGGSGTLYEIYSEALVENTSGRTGGLVGAVAGNFTMTNCWFNGTVTGKKSGEYTRTGGLIGNLEGTNNTISNCLNSGDVKVEVGTYTARYVGGLIGLVTGSLDIQNSLNTGTIQITAGSSSDIGAILGVQNNAVLTNVYSTPSDGATLDDSNKVLEADIMGTDAQTALPAEFFNDGVWTTVNAHTPVLTSLKTAVIDDTWYDKDKDTFTLYNKADLYGFATLSQTNDFAGKTVKLGDDIEVIAGDSDSWGAVESKNMWIPIGSSTVSFAGTFDGGLHTIRGIYLNATRADVGLFSYMAPSATVKNLYLKNSFINSTNVNTGSIAGVAQGTLHTIYSSATVVSTGQRVGGLVGTAANNFTMINGWFGGSVTSNRTTTDARVGGLVGSMSAQSNYMMYNCLNTGSVEASVATSYVGGLIGHAYSKATLDLRNSLNTGLVTYVDGTTHFGSLIGGSTGKITVTDGFASSESCTSVGTFTGADKTTQQVAEANIQGSLAEGTLTNFDFIYTWLAGTSNETPILNFAKVNESVDTSWYLGTEENVLYDMNDLYGFAELSKFMNFAGKTVKLGSDIVVNTGDANTWGTTEPENANVWEPIASNSNIKFAGIFDGQGHTISGIYMKTNRQTTGLFARTDNAIITNFRLTNSYFESSFSTSMTNLGSIVGTGLGTFEKIYSDAIVVAAGQSVGGFFGQLQSGSIMRECWFDGSVESTKTTDVRLGGLVGFAPRGSETTIENCLNSGMVNASKANDTTPYVGGLIGLVQSKDTTNEIPSVVNINYCYNTGKVKYNTGSGKYGAILGGTGSNSVVNIAATTHANSDSCNQNGITNGNIYRTAKSERIGDKATTYMTGFDFNNVWSTVPQNTPVLKAFVDVVCDTSWYVGHEDELTYVLYDKADLLGFSMISQTNDFAGKTVKLGTDIVVNTSDFSTWETTAPEYHWAPIGNSTFPFAGTFDGDLHTIQGLYLKSADACTGLFGITGEGAIIQNLKLINSYFESSAEDLGSIVGSCTGTTKIDKVYSNVTVKGSNARIGGLIGGSYSATTVQYCCYEGSITNTSTTNRFTGGILGSVSNPGTAVIKDCLIEGTIDVSANTSGMVYAGGVVGATQAVTISNCLVMADILVNETTLPYNFGLLTGYLYTSNNTISNNYGIIPDGWTDAIQNKVYSKAIPTEVTVSDVTGNKAKETLSGFDFYTIWSVRETDTPVLLMIPVTMDEYVVYSAEDLICIAGLSQTTNFAGKTIKLANDIDLAEYQWTPMGGDDSAKRFAGTFDGQDHTISGINVNATSNYTGLFAATATSAQIKNLILKDSQFVSTADYVGTVVGFALGGTFSNIRVENTKISGRGRLGGLIGSNGNAATTATITMNNCSFDGTITSPGTEKDYRYIGGLIGYVTGNMSLRMSNCMNSGTISANNNEASENPGVGGLVGCLMNIKSYEINSCLNVGEVNVKDTVTIEGEEVKVVGYGPIIGRITTTGTPLEIAESVNNYTVSSCLDADTVAGIISVDADAIKENAEATLPELDFETHWLAEAGNFPQVRFTTTGYVAVESIEVGETMLTKLTALYPETRELKQGDIHGHANNGGASDGTKTIAEWADQMKDPELDIDFAASLDHKETEHINVWKDDAENKHKFIYGSELATTIDKSTSNEMGLHYNMIFAKQADFVNVLNSETRVSDIFNSTIKAKFDYTTEDMTGNSAYEQVVNGETKYGHFKFPSFARDDFKILIDEVKLNNGFFVIAHPMMSPSYITADNAIDTYFADEVGIEVMNTVMTGSNAETGYKIWKTLLKHDKRVWATTGSDTHVELKTNVLTSIYAEQNSDEVSLGEAYVRYLRTGNFTAGSVGIQMSVGNTQMGGTGSFEDAYLEIGIGALHKSVYDENHKYRVDIWAEDGIIYSQPLNATTEDGQMTYLRTNADPNCKYYRVEVYDVTTKTRIALGNPIWNSAKYTTAE